jgi:hypothetical protein
MALRIALFVTLAAGAAFLVLYARLLYAPISISFLVPSVEKAVNRALAGFHFDVGDAVLRPSDSGVGIEFRLTQVRLVDDKNDPIVESPFASADVSLNALLAGRLSAGQIDLIGPRFFLQYSEDRGLALSFTDPSGSKGDFGTGELAAPAGQAVGGNSVGREAPAPAPAEETAAQPDYGVIRTARGRAVNLTHALNAIFDATRRGQSAYLSSFAIRDATVYFDRGDEIRRWSIPAAEIELLHEGKNSEAAGYIEIQSPSTSFQVRVRAGQNQHSGRIALNLAVDDIVPRAFAAEFPAFRLPAFWDMPVTASAELELGGNGDILAGTVNASLKQGQFYAPWDQKHPATIDKGDFRVTYSREEGVIRLAKSEISWGESRLKLIGGLQRQPETGLWAFQFGADEILLGAEQFGVPVIPLDRLLAQGVYDPRQGAVEIERFLVQAADAVIDLSGRIVHGRKSPAIQLGGRVSSMPVAFFKLIWPKFVAHGARDWIGRRVPAGRIAGGTVAINLPKDTLDSLASGGGIPPEAVNFKLDLEDLEVHYVKDLPPMMVPKGTAAVVGQRFLFNVPASEVPMPSGARVRFSDGQFIVGDLRPHIPNGEIHFKSEADAAAVLELLDQPSLGYIKALDMPVPTVQAKVTSAFSIAMPMLADLKFRDMKLNGRSELVNIRATGLPSGLGVHGGSLNFDVSEKALEARGELRMNGVPVQVSWQRIFDAPGERQPPLRLRAALNESAREELGLKLNHILRGSAPTELTVNFRKGAMPGMHFETNLTEAEILMASLGWRKPPGQRAVLTFNLDPAEDGGFELNNVNLRGDDLTVRGGMKIDENRRPVSFDLPIVALNLQTQLQINGDLHQGNVWRVHIRGQSYDGRQLFRSLFSAGEIAENQPKLPQDAPSVDVDAEIGIVIGFFDTTLKNVKVAAERRGDRLTSLDVYGQLNGKSPLAARLASDKSRVRQILAEATDAGSALRLVGFYPSARGGEVSLKVDLDGRGDAEKAGVLYARNFVIANDQVVEEVLSGPKAKRPPSAQQAYEQLQFDRMRVPFSVGNGRFTLSDAAINGPLLGATMRGFIDFKRERINLSGTYVPFYGINGAIGLVPILGDLLISRSGEGLFGITFAVKGSSAEPDVLVNPMSMVAPGFLRQLFEFEQNEPAVLPPRPRETARTSSDGRASSQPPVTR